MGTRTLSLILFGTMCLGVSAEEAPRFNRDIRPILSDNCFACHGPDANKRKGGLRLDTPEGAVAEGGIVPGDPAASTVYQRITTTDPDERMPPVDSEHSLTDAQIATLERWISSGAAYEAHWAIVPPAAPAAAAPVDDPEGWVRTGLDSHVLKRLRAEGLSPSPEAGRETLLRRVSLDLTGLPPTLEELDAYLADTAPGAYELAVERLLAAPAYGERMALDWLDVARYADTFGYQADVEMDVWPWRDWVIQAFNENLSYDQFITWQLAGDLLPNATREQRLATAFNRLHRQTNEGGSINEEFRNAYVADRTETFSTAFLGLTMNCARCHDHKFDPISQKDYFSLSAFFANIDESGLYSHFTRTSPTPSMFLYGERDEERHAMLKRKVARLEELISGADAAEPGFAQWMETTQTELPEAKPVLSLSFDDAEGKVPDAAAPERPATFIGQPQLVEGKQGKALAFDGDNGAQSEEAAAFERSDPFTLAMWIKVEQHIPKAVVAHRCKAESDAASRGYEIMLDEGRPVFSLIHFWPGNAIRIRASAPIPAQEWVHLAARYDGSSEAAGATLFVNGVQVQSEVIRDNLYRTIQYEGDPKTPFTLAQRFRDSGLKGGALDDVKVYDAALSRLELEALAMNLSVRDRQAALLPLAKADSNARTILSEYYAERVDAAANARRLDLHEARRREAAFVEKIPTIMTMEEMPSPRDTYILARGEYDKPTDKVEADAPAEILPFPAEQPRNRLGLARWLTDPNHPLTARVAVNRYWQIFFGKGLVETPEDFGSQGTPPVNQDLLDYLARRFIESGWDVKALCREIVSSATYRQVSTASPELRARDPFNQLLARGPQFRMNAEQIRDAALASSGLMTRTIGGPSVKPYQPPGLWEDASGQGYKADSGEALYRRGMYTFIKRTVPPPSMQTFDGAGREVCVVRRERTATPLQALVLLNDPQFVETARVLAERVLANAPGLDAAARINTLFRTLTSRMPSDAELRVLAEALAEQQAWFAAHPEDALKYADAGEAPRNESLDPVQVAATSALAQAIMNLDEFQVRR